jgi:hypothetical protein
MDRWMADPRNAGKTPPPPGDPRPMLLREILYMLALDHYIGEEMREMRTRIELLAAERLAMRSEAYSNRVLQQVRAGANASTR